MANLICPACNQETDVLVEHHWYELPNLELHTMEICRTCNGKLKTRHFYPKEFHREHRNILHHILPGWPEQLKALHEIPKPKEFKEYPITRAIGVRISTDDIDKVIKRAARKGWSFNKWINWAVTLGLRSHKKGGKNNDNNSS